MRPEFTRKPEFMQLAAEQKRRSFPLVAELLIFYLVHTVASLAMSIIVSVPMLIWLFSGEQAAQLMQAEAPASLMDTILRLLQQMPDWLAALIVACNALLGVAAILYCKCFEKREIRTLGLTGPHGARSYFLGAAIGAASFAAVFGLCAAFGGVAIRGVQPLQSLLPTLLLMLVVYVVQSAGEELLTRGYLMVSLSKRYRLPVCIGISSVVFALLHTGNYGVQPLALLNILLVGVVLALIVLLTGDLWAACGYHALWNFFQGNVFGLPVSGLGSASSLFSVEVTGYNQLLTGGDFGLEGSLSNTLILLAELGVLIYLLSRRQPEPDPTAGETQSE